VPFKNIIRPAGDDTQPELPDKGAWDFSSGTWVIYSIPPLGFSSDVKEMRCLDGSATWQLKWGALSRQMKMRSK
jgi:hypothetical protein